MGFWILRGYSTEGRSLIKAALALPAVQASDLAQAWALYVGAGLAESQSDHAESLKMQETCLALHRGMNNPREVAAALSSLAPARLELGDADGAEAGQREAMQIVLQIGDRLGEAIGLLHFGLIAIYRGDDAQAQASLENCLAVAREIQYNDIEGECELMLGETAFETGDIGRATQHFKRSLTVCREGGDKRGEANALWHLGRTELHDGDLVSARSRLDDALRAFQAFGMRGELLGCLEDHAMLALADRRPDAGVRIAGAVDVARERLGLKGWPRRAERWQTRVAALRSAVSAEAFRAAWDEGRQWQVEQAIPVALSTQVAAVAA
jgi:tetratricopeptide (TPR) repeat protein